MADRMQDLRRRGGGVTADSHRWRCDTMAKRLPSSRPMRSAPTSSVARRMMAKLGLRDGVIGNGQEFWVRAALRH